MKKKKKNYFDMKSAMARKIKKRVFSSESLMAIFNFQKRKTRAAGLERLNKTLKQSITVTFQDQSFPLVYSEILHFPQPEVRIK